MKLDIFSRQTDTFEITLDKKLMLVRQYLCTVNLHGMGFTVKMSLNSENVFNYTFC